MMTGKSARTTIRIAHRRIERGETAILPEKPEMSMTSTRRAVVTAMVALALISCGGGGDDEDEDDGPDIEDASGAGIWVGTFRIDGQADSAPMVGIVTEEGDFILVANGSGTADRMFFGTGTTNGNSFSANALSYNLANSSKTPSSLSGTVNDGVSLGGSYSLTGESATYSLQFRSQYNRSASLASVAGVYSLPANPNNLVVTVAINSNGALTVNASEPAGCTMNGTVTVPHANRNYYRWSGTFTSCGALNGQHSGVLHLDDTAPGTNNTIRMFGQNQAQTLAAWASYVK
jgi:hypothetical protein